MRTHLVTHSTATRSIPNSADLPLDMSNLTGLGAWETWCESEGGERVWLKEIDTPRSTGTKYGCERNGEIISKARWVNRKIEEVTRDGEHIKTGYESIRWDGENLIIPEKNVMGERIGTREW